MGVVRQPEKDTGNGGEFDEHRARAGTAQKCGGTAVSNGSRLPLLENAAPFRPETEAIGIFCMASVVKCARHRFECR